MYLSWEWHLNFLKNVVESVRLVEDDRLYHFGLWLGETYDNSRTNAAFHIVL